MIKFIKYLLIIGSLTALLIVTTNSLYQLAKDRHKLLPKIGIMAESLMKWRVNTSEVSTKQIPPIEIKNLKLDGNEHNLGKWSAPFDWPVIGLQLTLLPDGSVMSFGSYSVIEKENKDIRANKKITLSDGRIIERDAGDFQWHHHEVQGGTDFDIWYPNKGVGDNSHKTFIKPIFLDAFCAVVRVFDEDTVFILGGNPELKKNGADFQKATTFYKLSTQEFLKGKDLNHARWYGSIVRTKEDEFIMVGGMDTNPNSILNDQPSVIPEILEKNDNGDYSWRELHVAKSTNLFGNDNEEWNYPRAYLASNGDVFGISYNKMWRMDNDNNYSISQVGEIPLAREGISQILNDKSKFNKIEKEQAIKLLSISSSVGAKNNTVLIGKDKLIVLGGLQYGDSFAASNHVNSIDFSDIKNPKIESLKSMNYARADSNTTILPTGELFVNGGYSYQNDLLYSVFVPEIYNPTTNRWKELANGGHFRRGYHAASLLLPDGSILISGGDVWNSEIFYPPYLFEEDNNGRSIPAKRPEIKEVEKIIKKRQKIEMVVDDNKNIDKISLISTGSKTHAQGSEPKITFLKFEKLNNNKISFEIPENKNFIQNGSYLIFIVNNKNIPSKGKIIVLKS
jgi:hypothetical protein